MKFHLIVAQYPGNIPTKISSDEKANVVKQPKNNNNIDKRLQTKQTNLIFSFIDITRTIAIFVFLFLLR